MGDPEIKQTCKGRCKVLAWKGDKTCDDDNNNCGCGWDGGDCCGKKNKYTHCVNCLCVDPKYKAENTGCSGTCEIHAWKGDGKCDDGNNNCGCGWDGGDCCGKSGGSLPFAYCSNCQCKNPAKAVKCPGTKKCTFESYVGDKRCDDQNNNCNCNWDDGDCCGESGDKYQFSYCESCKCLDPAADAPKCEGHCGSPNYKGDGNCDDNNNNCGCDYDGGDCCGKNGGQYQYSY